RDGPVGGREHQGGGGDALVGVVADVGEGDVGARLGIEGDLEGGGLAGLGGKQVGRRPGQPRLDLEGADIAAVAAGDVGHAGQVVDSRLSGLVGGRATAD